MCKTVFEYLLPPFSKRLLIHTEKYRVHGFLAALMWFTVSFPNYVVWEIVVISVNYHHMKYFRPYTVQKELVDISFHIWLTGTILFNPMCISIARYVLNIVYMLSFIYLSVSTPLQPLPRSILPYSTLLRVSLSCSLCPNYESAFCITLRPQRCSLIFPRTCSFVFF